MSVIPDEPRVIVAMDFPDAHAALGLAEKLDPTMCRLKVGKELFTRSGPELVRSLQESGFDVFLDLKFHDIPNTTAAAVTAAADLGVWMVNVHASGGEEMLKASRNAVPKGQGPLLIGVTVLTSMNQHDLESVGVKSTPLEQVNRLASLCHIHELDGVVCSSMEASPLRERFPDSFLLVTPGIRPAGSASDDQKRIVTPADAISNGSSYLVVGRPVTRAEDPLQALKNINKEISGNF